MAQDVGNYDPKEVSVIFDGNTLEGFADGAFINVTRDVDNTIDVSGADSFVSRAKQNDKRGSIVVTLQQTSESNKILSRYHKGYQEKKDPGKDPAPVIIKDNSGESIHSASQAWILKPADSTYSKNIENRAWTIRCADLESNPEGN
jgi:hypothetical protein